MIKRSNNPSIEKTWDNEIGNHLETRFFGFLIDEMN